MNTKILRTVLIIISVASAITLWFTRSEWLNSLSSFALSENVMWYRTMHICAILFLMSDARNNKHSYYLAFGMSLILIFDMYHHFWLHTIFTASTLAFACFSIIYNNLGFEKNVMYFLSFVAIFIFCIGYFVQSFHFLMAEIIALSCIYIGKLREIWS